MHGAPLRTDRHRLRRQWWRRKRDLCRGFALGVASAALSFRPRRSMRSHSRCHSVSEDQGDLESVIVRLLWSGSGTEGWRRQGSRGLWEDLSRSVCGCGLDAGLICRYRSRSRSRSLIRKNYAYGDLEGVRSAWMALAGSRVLFWESTTS